MTELAMNKKDDITMRLVHYFVTEENYNPIVVNGVKNEIWLENSEGPFKIIRINSNYIHNDEQYKYDMFKIKNVMKQIKKKTVSLSMNALNLLLDVNDRVNLDSEKKVESVRVAEIDDSVINELIEFFPALKEKILLEIDGIDLIMNVTKDINDKTEKENKIYERTFSPKKLVMTYFMMAICTVMFFVTMFMSKFSFDSMTLAQLGAIVPSRILDGEWYRLIAAAFLHGGIIHFYVNMQSLFVVGKEVETVMGKWRFLVIFLGSALTASLMSCVLTNSISVGASGAIFGLLGAFLYFGYHYRLYLGSVLRQQIIPTILLNLIIGFMLPMIDNAAHIGGLIGGYFIAMAVGVKDKSKPSDRINGIILTLIYIGFLGYMFFFR